MGIADKMLNRIGQFYRQSIVKEQYPMLTSFSRRTLKKEGVLGLVYMMHHICEKDAKLIPTNEDLKVSPAFLEASKAHEFFHLSLLHSRHSTKLQGTNVQRQLMAR